MRTGTTTVSGLQMILGLLGRVLSGALSRAGLMIMALRNLLLHAGSPCWTSCAGCVHHRRDAF